MNEKGSSLLVVLLITLIFSVLGLAVLGASVNNVKRTEIREAEIETTANTKVLMSEVVAKLQENLNNTIDEKELQKETPSTDYKSQVETAVRNTASAFTGVTIEINNEEIYKQYGISDVINFKKNNFLRIYEIKIDNTGADSGNPAIKRTITENVILSPTPSFLNYAVGAYGKRFGTDKPININDVIGKDEENKDIKRGSDSALIINGSPDIIGNVFAPTLELNSRANYIKNNTRNPTGDFQGPSIFGTLYTKKINKDNQPSNPEGKVFYPFFDGEFDEKIDGINGIPAIKSTGSNFVDMDFDETFYLKWIESGAPKLPILSDGSLANNPLYGELNCSDDNLFKALENLDAMVENNHIVTGDPDELMNDFTTVEKENGKITSTVTPHDGRYNNPKFTCKNKDGTKPVYLIEESMLETYNVYKAKLFDTDVKDTTNTIFFTNIDRFDPENEISTERRLLNTYIKNKDEDKTPMPNILKIGGDNNLLLKNPDNREKGWLVVNGSLEINGSEELSTAPVIKGNILVNGDLYIRSTDAENDDKSEILKFDATIYVRGNTTIDNVNIYGADGKQLVVISNGDLKIVRVNEYDNAALDDKSLVNIINTPPNLKGVFYTNKTATLYGVGSLFQIEGGIFAREQLIINAIRYKFPSTESIDVVKFANYNSYEGLRSRFYVEYDNRVITDQLSSLPRVNRLQVIVDNQVIH
ncbi:hypothetical protein P9E76_11090 [Schinkia azotoformans]|uniref:Uncharacterized protein n=1 Tax=Schinkia azotoformans LMG 9581 TaxID=1131731 RepID=K6C1I8_SCHAZ|nr:hypothetical protein [Schinkia azotoformans]EKN64985.1 hypothetical protein BAZO_12314 [Schinkia azotoformans LMG 9581]MEC1640239.1 hypothetical protein [Schinkia azotoformans]MEC1720352.1 hypothetical protein [Schinkia azotoformans]MEC1945588.1 hypothetical protein [Schinkia azotoformans]MED4413355.1 hypothetical protein [Schinkia azotoformans]